MPNLPAANTTLNDQAGAFGSGDEYIVVMSCVSQNADGVPRVFASTSGLLAEYDYSPGVSYCASHFAETDLPVIFVGLPIATAGTVVRQDNSEVTGTAAITVSAAASGIMEKVSGSITVQNGGLVGTNEITFYLSCDGGISTQLVNLGTGTTYTIPNLGIVLTFSEGELNANDYFAFQTSGPMWGSTAISAAQAALAAQENLSRSWLVVGGVSSSTVAGYVLTAVNAYDTADQRFTFARAEVKDFLPLPENSKVSVAMTAYTSVTFAATGHTITRVGGSFITDGFAVGQIVTIAGSTSNNGILGVLTGVSGTVLTFASGCVNEGPDTTGVSITASPTITFAASGFTVTRSSGSWLTEGFAVGQTVSFTGTTSNNFTGTITALSATVMTFASGVTNEGPDPLANVTCVVVQTFGGDVTAQTSALATVVGPRIDLAYGHGRKQCPITGWNFRRPSAWAASLREYQHDYQIPCWRKSDGTLNGWSITDDNGNVVEYDERVDGGALAGGFTCLRSYGNGPAGAFVALSLTRDAPGSIFSRTQNMTVTNLAMTTVQTATENEIGDVLVLNSDGTGTNDSLSLLEKRVNRQLQIVLLQQYPEGQRASNAVWAASRTAVLNVPEAELPGILTLNLNGTLEQIDTSVVVPTAGA